MPGVGQGEPDLAGFLVILGLVGPGARLEPGVRVFRES